MRGFCSIFISSALPPYGAAAAESARKQWLLQNYRCTPRWHTHTDTRRSCSLIATNTSRNPSGCINTPDRLKLLFAADKSNGTDF